MATNPNIALSYQPNVALQRRDPLADAANIQSLQANQTKMDDLREFKEFSTRLAAAGKDPDPLALAREMKASGRPEMVMKALELETQIKALGLEDQAYKALIGGGAAAPAMPQAAPAAAPGSFAADVATRRAAMPANTLAPAPVASTNAMVPAPAMDPQTQEITRLMGIATRFPTTKAGMQAMKNAELLQKMNNPYVVGGRLVTGGGKELYAAPPETNDIKEFEFAVKKGYRGSFTDFMQIKPTASAARSFTAVNTNLPASEEVQKEFMREMRQTFGALKQAPTVLDNIDKAKALVPQAKGFMGAGGESMLQAASFLNNRLGTSIDTKGVQNAEELRSRLFLGIMDNLKKLDSQPSQQQQAALQVALGSIGTDPSALPRVLDVFGDTIRQKVDLHNEEAQGAESRGVKFPYNPIIKLPPRPAAGDAASTAGRPAGVGANWSFMTDAKGNKAWVSPDNKSFVEVK